jgi:phosphoglycolate phosphatase
MSWQAVLFDLDGTLLDTLTDIGDAANVALQRCGFPTRDLDEYRFFVGDGVRTLFQRALPQESVSDASVMQCVGEFRRQYAEGWNVRTRPYAGVPELLDELSRRRIRLSVLSNKPDDFTNRCVQHYLSQWRFEIVRGQRDGVPLKPDPMAANEIADSMQVPTEQFLFLGDTSIDMLTAMRAGMYPVGALWGFRPREELETAGAQHLIERPQELLELLL